MYDYNNNNIYLEMDRLYKKNYKKQCSSFA